MTRPERTDIDDNDCHGAMSDPCSSGRLEGVRSRSRFWIAAVLALAMAACAQLPGQEPDPPKPSPDEVDELDVVAAVPVSAGQIVLQRPDGLDDVTADPLVPGLALRLSSDENVIRLVWVGEEVREGAQVRLAFDFAGEPGEVPEFVDRIALADAEGEDLGEAALTLEPTDATAPSGTGLHVADVDHTSVPDADLQASFADHPLGDVSADGVLDVRDALRALERANDGAWSAFELYHSDLDANYVTDGTDLSLLLDKIVDPLLPAHLHVKPREISFVQLDDASDDAGIVLIANQGRAPLEPVDWTFPEGLDVTQVTGVSGQSMALRPRLETGRPAGWVPGFLTVEHADESFAVRVGHLVVLIAGQSNATGLGSPLEGWPETPRDDVRMLGNDYVWKDAVEPLDAPTGQVDPVTEDKNTKYSMGTRLGNLLNDATGFTTYLIPSTRNGSELSQWLPGADRLGRNTLFGVTNFRAHVSAGLRENPVDTNAHGSEAGPVSVLVWYQGESDAASESVRRYFQERTDEVMDAFEEELGVAVVYVQLASDYERDANARLHAVAELQRKMETSFGRPEFHMVPAFDLPRSHQIHLSAYGQRVLAERVDLAIRQHVLGEPVDGTGPRLDELRSGGGYVYVKTTHELVTGSLDASYFTVFDGAPVGNLDEFDTYGTNDVDIASVVVDPGDPRTVRIELGGVLEGTPYVRYMAQPNTDPASDDPSMEDTWQEMASGIAVAADGGLPLPVFGPLQAPASPYSP